MTIEDVFGSGRELDALQMGARALVLFFVLLALIRLAGMRAFGRKSAFDAVIVITLGAVVSRVIVGASPALPTVAAALVLAALHRAIAMLAASAPAFERVIKGRSQVLYRGGIFDLPRMHRAGISRADIDEALRHHSQGLSLREVLEIRLETSGKLSIIADRVGMANRLTPQPGQPPAAVSPRLTPAGSH